MIVKTLEDVVGTQGEAHGSEWHSLRLLHREDGMGMTLTDSILGSSPAARESRFERQVIAENHHSCIPGRTSN